MCRIAALGAERHRIDALIEDVGKITGRPPAKGECPVSISVQETEASSGHVRSVNGYTDWVHRAMTD